MTALGNLVDRFRAAIPGLQPKLATKAEAPTAATRPALAADTRQTAVATPEDVARSLDAAGKKAFGALGPSDQAAYATAWQVAGSAGRDRLATLLKAGKMADQDAQGQSLAANLGRLPGLPLPDGAPYQGAEVLGQVLEHLTNPSVINQSSRNTCGATTVQYMLLREQPAEYARLVGGLMGEGRVALRSGDTMNRVYDSVAQDDTDRDDVERVIQSAFQDHGFELRGRYSNATDDFRKGPRDGDGWLDKLGRAMAAPGNWVVRQLGDKGIAEGKVKELYEDVTGHEATLIGDLPGGLLLAPRGQRQDVYEQVLAAVEAGKEVPVDIVLDKLQDKPGEQVEHVVDQAEMSYIELMSSHQVLVTKVEGDRVHYRNPWGYDTSMSKAEFESRLTDAFIPR